MKKINGFTLIELLVAMIILGIITGLSIPLIRGLISKNANKKYETYGDAMINSAKLYCDSYNDDLFGNNTNGCAVVTLEDLIDKRLIKDYSEDNLSCLTDKSWIKIVKSGNKYTYGYQLYCGEKGADNRPINPKLLAASDSEQGKTYSDASEICS